MPITATFSNGFTDVYKGDRAVKAAWAIISRSTGEVINSGHSMDRATAQKTAEGNLRNTKVPGVDHSGYAFTGRATPGYYAKQAREYYGWAGKGDREALAFLKAHNADITARKRAAVIIEIVDL
jgi:hypothetical protein